MTLQARLRRRAAQVAKRSKQWLDRNGAQHRCYLCARPVRHFLPYREGSRGASPFTRALEVIGSDVDNFACPACGCHDRERHLAMYFDRLEIWRRFEGADVLHFAPEAQLTPKIEARRPKSYVRADLLATGPGLQRLDVTQIDLPDASIDVVLCNHVLEHVPDDARAISELARVLRPGGLAILQTPWSPLLSRSFTDPAITTDALRARLYGQEDHVRVYGRDLFERIEAGGLRVTRHSHAHALPDLDSRYYGVNPREDLILAEKPR